MQERMAAPDSDDPLARLRALPAHTPSPELDARVLREAQQALAAGAAPRHGLFDLLVYRTLLPTAVAAVVVIYLNWAVQAASRLLS